LQATQRLTFGIISVPGGWRYSPVVLAQATATLGQMFPGRIPWVALGSGQAMNEAPTGLPWPEKQKRNARLREGAEIVRALLAGETVTHRGRVSVVDAKVWSWPKVPTRLVGAATGRWAVRPPGTGPFYCAMLEGGCELDCRAGAGQAGHG
jgi:alkanesulfonate monooxygenase SsuD/methylene tetrahydromethanopterin reductase-like flavin-dependent oxidoreductase (luciferase family)